MGSLESGEPRAAGREGYAGLLTGAVSREPFFEYMRTQMGWHHGGGRREKRLPRRILQERIGSALRVFESSFPAKSSWVEMSR